VTDNRKGTHENSKRVTDNIKKEDNDDNKKGTENKEVIFNKP
jgi:hypothetical protein